MQESTRLQTGCLCICEHVNLCVLMSTCAPRYVSVQLGNYIKITSSFNRSHRSTSPPGGIFYTLNSLCRQPQATMPDWACSSSFQRINTGLSLWSSYCNCVHSKFQKDNSMHTTMLYFSLTIPEYKPSQAFQNRAEPGWWLDTRPPSGMMQPHGDILYKHHKNLQVFKIMV